MPLTKKQDEAITQKKEKQKQLIKVNNVIDNGQTVATDLKLQYKTAKEKDKNSKETKELKKKWMKAQNQVDKLINGKKKDLVAEIKELEKIQRGSEGYQFKF